jgi:hypothetical protein
LVRLVLAAVLADAEQVLLRELELLPPDARLDRGAADVPHRQPAAVTLVAAGAVGGDAAHVEPVRPLEVLLRTEDVVVGHAELGAGAGREVGAADVESLPVPEHPREQVLVVVPIQPLLHRRALNRLGLQRLLLAGRGQQGGAGQ